MAGIEGMARLRLDDARVVRALFARTPWLRELPIDGQPVAETLPRQLTFRFTGSGDWAKRSIRPDSAAARELLEGPSGDHVRRTLSRMVGTLDARAGQARLDSLTLATSHAGFSLSTLIDGIAWRDPKVRSAFEAALADPGARPRFEQSVKKWVTERRGYDAEYNGGIVTGPAGTAFLTDLFEGRRITSTATARGALEALAHDFEHAAAPTSAGVYYGRRGVSSLGKLEEGIAQYMTRHGGLQRMANALGVRLGDSDSYSLAYADLVRGVERLVWEATAGWTRRGSQQAFAELDSLLREVPVEKLPRRLAESIGVREQLPARDVRFIEQRIRTSAGNHDKYRLLSSEIDARAAAAELARP